MFGIQTRDIQLNYELTTSDNYIVSLAKYNAIFEVSYASKKILPERLGVAVKAAIERSITGALDQLQASRFFR
ncbi:MAG: hypothetical protein ACJAUP_000131 [Cellvibrionaceae bacterium]